MMNYFASPMKLFGKFGLWSWFTSIVALICVVLMKFLSGTDMTGNPFLLLSVLAMLIGTQFFSLGLLGEVCARIYYRGGERRTYEIRETVNLDVKTERRLVRAA